MIASVLAGKLLGQACGAMDACVAVGMVMEAAIIASKLDPDLVDPGRWKIGPSARGLQIARDDRIKKIA
jgi:hypothetical protein